MKGKKKDWSTKEEKGGKAWYVGGWSVLDWK